MTLDRFTSPSPYPSPFLRFFFYLYTDHFKTFIELVIILLLFYVLDFWP